MTATPPPSSGDNPPTAPGPDFEAASYGRYSASSSPSASVPPAPVDPAPYGLSAPTYGTTPPPTDYGTPQPARGYDLNQPTPGYGTAQPAPSYDAPQPARGYEPPQAARAYDYGTSQPADGYDPNQAAPGYGTGQPSAASYGTPAQGPYAGSHAYVDPYAPPGGYPDPTQYAPAQTYGDPTQYAPAQTYGGATQYAPTQGYPTAAFGEPQGYAPQGYAPQAPVGQGYGQPGGYPGYAMAPMAMGTPLPTGMAVAAMVCGIVGVVLSLCGWWTIPLSAVGIVLGVLAFKKANRGQAGGRSMALTGIITGSVGAAIAVIVSLIQVLALFAYSR